MNKYVIVAAACFTAIACNSGNQRADAYGNFEATEINVSAEQSGKLLFFTAEEGNLLDSGQFVALIDTIPLHLKELQLLANRQAIAAQSGPVLAQMDVLQTQLSHAHMEEERFAKLLAGGAATQKQYDDIQNQIKVLQSQIKSIASQHAPIFSQVQMVDAQLQALRDQINRCRIINPTKGTVLVKIAEQGEMTGAGRPLYRLADLSTMYLRAYASGDQLPHMAIGDEVEVLIDDTKTKNTNLHGIISWIASEAEFTPKIVQTKEDRVDMVYAFKVRVENDGSLKIGMPGEVNFLKTSTQEN